MNQNEIMEAANSLRKAVVDVIHTGVGALANATEVCCLFAIAYTSGLRVNIGSGELLVFVLSVSTSSPG